MCHHVLYCVALPATSTCVLVKCGRTPACCDIQPEEFNCSSTIDVTVSNVADTLRSTTGKVHRKHWTVHSH